MIPQRLMAWTLGTVVALAAASSAHSQGLFYSLDTEQPSGSPMKLVMFPSNPGDGQNVTVIADVPGLPQDPVGGHMDLSPDGRLFFAPLSNTVYALDPTSGATLGSLSITGDANDHISGVAVWNGGIIYLNQDLNPGARLWLADFDAQQVSVVMTTSTKVDDIDFDSEGNLIGEDLNDSGNLYRLPLDGSQPTVAVSLGIQDVAVMTYSPQEEALFFKTGRTGQILYRVAWSGGQPAGAFEHIENIGPGHYVGLAAIPEPGTLAILGLGGLALIRRRTK